jgi:hypothetical protein
VTWRESTPARISFWVFVTAAVCLGRAFGQDPLDYVPNRPYTAQFVQTYTETESGSTRAQGESRIVRMRDSQGRTRIETLPPDDTNCRDNDCSKPDVVNLYLPLQRQFIQLFPGRKTASVMIFPGTGPIPRHVHPNDKNIKKEDLPGRMINGIYAVGTRITQLSPSDNGSGRNVLSVGEEWISPDLNLVILNKHKSADPLGDDTITQIKHFDRSEPDPALFQIPTDYKILTDSPQLDAASPSTQ